MSYVQLTSTDWDDRFSQAFILSVIAHVVVVFGIHFVPANPKLFESQLPMEVVLVNSMSADKPLKPDVLAQANLDGGGDVDARLQAKSPLPALTQDSAASAENRLTARAQALEEQARLLMQQTKSSYAVREPKAQPDSAPRPPEPNVAPTDLVTRSLEMAKLAARIDQEWQASQNRPRRAFVGARAQEFVFARYVEDWRLKVERYGNNNYPEEARRQGLYGTLVLTVEIGSDGRVLDVHVERPSGSKLLDAAAVKIVENAGPYSAFPVEMRKKVDILSITRTWSFTRSDQLTTQ